MLLWCMTRSRSPRFSTLRLEKTAQRRSRLNAGRRREDRARSEHRRNRHVRSRNNLEGVASLGFEKFGRFGYVSQTKINPLLSYLEKGQIAATRCKKCGRTYFPPRAECLDDP